MRSLFLAALLALGLTGCTDKTEFGPCVGAFEEERRDPALDYRMSTTNVVVAVIFWETVIVPAIVVLDETYCPIGRK